jgi:uracil-DNA glycosylase
MKSKKAKLEALRTKMQAANLHLKKTAHHLVFGHGSDHAAILFVGEAPGKNEDLQGLPFVGSAGKVLNQMLESIKLERDDVYITSILKYRPPNNRNPSLKEIISHTPYLIDQIRIIQPKVIVPLGNFATRFILGGMDVKKMGEVPAISLIHGKIKEAEFEGHCYKVIPLYHPAAVLYQATLKKTLLKDFKVLGKLIKTI